MKETRNTIQKNLILSAVYEMKNHPTAEMIYDNIRKEHSHISKATVYRNLNQMAENGEILKVDIANAPSIYDFNINKHYHFKCNKCENVYDFNFNEIRKIEELLNGDKNFKVESIEVVIKGLCENCKNNNYNIIL